VVDAVVLDNPRDGAKGDAFAKTGGHGSGAAGAARTHNDRHGAADEQGRHSGPARGGGAEEQRWCCQLAPSE